MQPEDIDKLFRDRLEGHAPTPPAYLWAQLEEELQPAKKRPVRWLWATAAAVALLLTSGLLWLQLASVPSPAPLATGPRPERATSQSVQTAAQLEKNAVAAAPQATLPPTAASSPSEAVVRPDASAVLLGRTKGVHTQGRLQIAASTRRHTSQILRAAPVKTSPMPTPGALADATPKAQPERLSLVAEALPTTRPTVATTAIAATSVASTGPIEVEVRRSNESSAMAVSASESSSRRSLGGILLRQARNAVRGERVSLAETGLPETVTVEAHVAGRTLTKVIQL